MKLCAIVPAAGRGSRLGLDRPKILAPLAAGVTIWSVLSRKLLAVADHLNVIVAPDAADLMARAIAAGPEPARCSIAIQPRPLGMGDAIFRGERLWADADAILVVWGDQVFVSAATLAAARAAHRGAARAVVIPVVPLAAPYVEYVFDRGRLKSVRQSREGDRCAPGGLGDVGAFLLSVSGLREAWAGYAAAAAPGSATGEINFLPFLPWLAAHGWTVAPLAIDDPREARGVNTPADLEFFRAEFARGAPQLQPA